jgi:hypothetical protein
LEDGYGPWKTFEAAGKFLRCLPRASDLVSARGTINE